MTPNSLLSSFVASLSAATNGASDSPYDYLSDDLQIEIIGNTPVSGSYNGMEQVRGILASTIRRRLDNFTIQVRDTVCNAESVAALLIVRGTMKSGNIYNDAGGNCALYAECKNGKFRKIILYPDTDELLSAAFDMTARSGTPLS